MSTNQRRNNVLPKKKVDLISKLVTLVQEVTKDIDLQHFLISLYDETANDKYTGDLFGGRSVDIAKKIIQNHTVGMHQKDSLGVQRTVPVWNLNSKLKEIC